MPALKRPDWYKADMNPDEMKACLVKNLRVDADLATRLAQRYQNDFCNEIGNEMLDCQRLGHQVRTCSRAQTVGRRIIRYGRTRQEGKVSVAGAGHSGEVHQSVASFHEIRREGRACERKLRPAA